MRTQSEQRASVSVELIAAVPEIGEGGFLQLVRPRLCLGGGDCMQHECLHVGVFLLFNQFLLQINFAAAQNPVVDLDSSVSRE